MFKTLDEFEKTTISTPIDVGNGIKEEVIKGVESKLNAFVGTAMDVGYNKDATLSGLEWVVIGEPERAESHRGRGRVEDSLCRCGKQCCGNV